LYLRSDAILRYAERELKLKLFPTDGKLELPKAAVADTPATTSPAAGPARSDAASASPEKPAVSAPSAKLASDSTGENADADAMHLPGIADLQALLGSGDADNKPGSKEAPPATFEPADAVRRAPQAAAPAEAEAEADGSTRTLTLRRTLRSGAAIHFEGDVIVVGDVNAGAQIRAAGNIIVLGKLRGVVHAGAQGDETSFILAFDLAPTQLRIARHIAIAPARAASDDAFRPEIATVADAAIVIEPWRGTRRR
jgi:septum site-determining protein MinC